MAAPAATPRERPAPGVLERVAPGVRRLVADLPGPFTFTGTCSYLLGDEEGAAVVIDPGPEDPTHIAALLAATGGRVAAILVTHTHRDHSPGARPLAAASGAPIWGPPARARGGGGAMEGSFDAAHAPDRALTDGERVEAGGVTLEVVATPGHTADHLAFSTGEALFSGDHVMAWSTSVVAPPDGDMGAYMASLAKLLARDEAVYWPGHGGPVRTPRPFVRGLIHHRRAREALILAAVEAGLADPAAIAARAYEALAPALLGAATLSTLAHLIDLRRRGLVQVEGTHGSGERYRGVVERGDG